MKAKKNAAFGTGHRLTHRFFTEKISEMIIFGQKSKLKTFRRPNITLKRN
jgi:hypothetical protein